MSKVRLLKIWLCVGMLFAFLSGGTMSWFLNQFVHRLEALPAKPEMNDEWRDRFIEEFGLDGAQAEDLTRILEEYWIARLELQEEYRRPFTELQQRYEERIVDILTPEQMTRYELYEGGE